MDNPNRSNLRLCEAAKGFIAERFKFEVCLPHYDLNTDYYTNNTRKLNRVNAVFLSRCFMFSAVKYTNLFALWQKDAGDLRFLRALNCRMILIVRA